ncbi:MAG: alpha/beta fold hydrolase, partial [Actinomycetota bacterium]|nr:alpha/beta fold hydrolase [Actinomycetota bacterium]
AADQLAYIYFTSGSTGEPKGAMCEHAGMLNHLYAKIDDLEIGEGHVVAQTAPQCFDISLWQLVSALLVGGRTLLVEQEVILDVQRFVDKIVDGRVRVLQVVPSYLEVVLSYLEQHPRELSDLRCVSVTGEALKKELTQRWFAAEPEIKLVNAYGLTETSDDTNHEVMDRAPDSERVPLGPAVNNVHVYVVDEHLSPVPLGAPGAIVFSGVCVGRGYVNDPERTRSAYLADPHREGQRLYRGGDYGRWQPEGKLEFLGRRDTQVKISGFRIEIGEIENTLLRVPGVRDGAVVVAEGGEQSKHLVAFYSGQRPLEVKVLRDRLGESLPEYMVPSAFHWRDSLPLTANSKIDRKTLTALAEELDVVEEDFHAPSTPTEQRLAAAWAKVLGIPVDQIGRRDHFFDRGGTSLSAVKLAITLHRAVSLKDLTRHPILADLAGLVDGRSQRRSGLLQPLSESDGAQAGALVCFPYAGGNAVNFQPMAGALRDSGLAVYAVELPGHDVATESEPFTPMAQVVEQVVTEITRRGLTGVLLWGHSSGTAFAVATARKLQERGLDVQRVFLGAQLLGDATNRRATITELTRRSNAEIAAGLSADGGYTELGELDAQRAEHVGAAYRHDCVSAHRYFADALDTPPVVKLSVPVTVVVAADDPSTAKFPRRHRDWQLLAEHVDLYELADGGHYFLRTRPTEAAQAVLRAAALLAAS